MTGLKHAIRSLIRTPFILAVSVLSLALGIGANSAVFSLCDQILLQQLPVQDPDRLVNLNAPGPKPGSTSCNDAGDCSAVFSYPMFRDLEKAQTSFTGLAAHRLFGANLSYAKQTRSGQGLLVSGSYFPVLGIRPVIGRLLAPADDQTIGAHPVTVLSYRYWENELGADSSILNQNLIINGQAMTVVGVAPPGFRGTTLGSLVDVFVPLTMRGLLETNSDQSFEDRLSYWLYLFARLNPETTLEQAGSHLNTLYSGIINEIEAPLQTGMLEQTLERFRAKRIEFEPGRQGQSSFKQNARTPVLLLLTITAVVLLIACANIANLLLARGTRRGAEMAVRGSLGASRRQLVTPLLTESLLLAVLGGLASLLVSHWTLRLIGSLLPPDAGEFLVLKLQPPMIVFAAGVSILTGFLFGLYPALHATRRDLVTALRSQAGQASGARSATRFRSAMVTIQIAMSMALLVAAGLFIKSLVNVSRIDLGLRTENMVTFHVAPELNGYPPERSRNFFQQLTGELETVPGVSAVTSAMVPVLGGSSWGTSVRVEDFEKGPGADNNSRYNLVGPGFFSTMGMALLAGREFTETDQLSAPRVAVINEAFARKFGLDSRQSVGKFMGTGTGDLDIQIVGIVQDAKYNNVTDEIPPIFFLPYLQNRTLGFLNFYLRTEIDSGQIMRTVPGVVARLDPNLPVDRLLTLEERMKSSLTGERIIGTLSSAFALLATLLAAIGLYGVIAYSVSQRTREFGLRVALGASSSRIQGMVIRQVARLAVIGGGIGMVAGLGMGRAARSLLYGLEGHDPLVIVLVTILLAGIALGAGYLPARRASQVDPMRALRHD